MSTLLPIGEFSRLTHLTVKTLRHYHDVGLLTPEDVDPHTGYRRYALDQVPAALLIGRLRALQLPVPEVRRAVTAGSDTERDAIIAAHLRRMEDELEQTRGIVGSLRRLLQGRALEITHRVLPSIRAVALTERVARTEIGPWCSATFTSLYVGLLQDGITPTGPGAAAYEEAFFTEGLGEVTAYVPIADTAKPSHQTTTITGGLFAVAVHAGAFTDFDTTYAALGTHVAEHDVLRPGPIRELYLASPPEVTDPTQFRTEVCWPIAG